MLFRLGRVVATPACLEFCKQHSIDPLMLLARHSIGDWGDSLSPQDIQANIDALSYGTRLFSAYDFPQGKVWVITEADRSSTCILLPDDY